MPWNAFLMEKWYAEPWSPMRYGARQLWGWEACRENCPLLENWEEIQPRDTWAVREKVKQEKRVFRLNVLNSMAAVSSTTILIKITCYYQTVCVYFTIDSGYYHRASLIKSLRGNYLNKSSHISCLHISWSYFDVSTQWAYALETIEIFAICFLKIYLFFTG